ncbi:hypothetical protein KI387_023625, partial [Taxus chinensis]
VEVNEEKYEDEREARGKGGSEEINMKDQRTLSMTKEQIEDATKREVAGIIKDSVDQEVEHD